jgi:multidrug efflux pump subunit AcrA (membrane-fusion protein)
MLVRMKPAPGVGLTAGDAIDVQLPVSWNGAGVKVPRDALLLDPDQARVLEVEAGVATARDVEVLATADGFALVTGEGLSVGDAVVTRGNERVRPGQAVRVEGAEAE